MVNGTKHAQAMVTIYGLNEKVGNISYYDSSGQSEYSFGKPYSEQTAKVIDEEISNIVETQYKRAIQILNDNRDKLDALAQKLLDKEVIFREDLELIFGKRAWDPELTEQPVSNSEAALAEEQPASEEEAITPENTTNTEV